MSRRLTTYFSIAAMTLACLATTDAVRADWSEDFNGSTLQNAWLFGSTSGAGSPSGTFLPSDQLNNYPDAIVNSQLQMSDANSVAAGGAANGFGVVLENFTDLRYAGVINPNGNSAVSDTLALIARGSLASGKFYAAEVSFEDGKLIIFRNDDLAGSAEDLAETTIPGLTNADSVFVDFTLIGSSLTARAFDQRGGTLLGTVAASDSNYSQGISGVLGFFAGDVNKPFLGEFDDLSSAAIPEPTSTALALSGLCGVMATLRRRR